MCTTIAGDEGIKGSLLLNPLRFPFFSVLYPLIPRCPLSLPSQRASPLLLEAAENWTPPAAAVKGVQMSGSAHSDRPPRGEQESPVHEVVGETGSEYEVTVLTKLWLPKASADPKLVRKYRAERRAATTKVRTRWSSRLQNRRCATDQLAVICSTSSG